MVFSELGAAPGIVLRLRFFLAVTSLLLLERDVLLRDWYARLLLLQPSSAVPFVATLTIWRWCPHSVGRTAGDLY